VTVICTSRGSAAALDDEYPHIGPKARVIVRYGVYQGPVNAWDVNDLRNSVGALWGIPWRARAFTIRRGRQVELLESDPVLDGEIIEFRRLDV
jgi:hypothetical protein